MPYFKLTPEQQAFMKGKTMEEIIAQAKKNLELTRKEGLELKRNRLLAEIRKLEGQVQAKRNVLRVIENQIAKEGPVF